MEIIGTTNYVGWGIVCIIFGVILLTLVSIALYDKADYEIVFVPIIVGVSVLIVGIISVTTPKKYYKLKVNENVTVGQLSKEYKIVKYSPEDDVWIVEKKGE